MNRTVELRRARVRAWRLYRGKAFREAYVAGARARLNGRPAEACPYAPDPGKTWRHAYRRAWLRGYESVTG